MNQNFQHKKPVIGIVEPIELIREGCFTGSYRTYANYPYVEGIVKGGGVPLGLPLVLTEEDCEAQASLCDGLILSGGADLDPHLYGQEPKLKQGYSDRRMDHFFIRMIHAARKLGVPVLGVCRGIQAVNVAFGGTLIQDIPTEVKDAIQHDQDAPPSFPCHFIKVEKDSFIGAFMPETSEVNSFHHQALGTLGTGLRITARSTDGIIEAVESTEGSPVIAVQWHPEMMQEKGDVLAEELFARFIRLCAERNRL